MSAQRPRRWVDIVQMLYKCFVFAWWLHLNPYNAKIIFYIYTRRQIKNDQPGSHDFGDFSDNFEPISLKLQRPFSIKILTAVKKMLNFIYYFKS